VGDRTDGDERELGEGGVLLELRWSYCGEKAMEPGGGWRLMSLLISAALDDDLDWIDDEDGDGVVDEPMI